MHGMRHQETDAVQQGQGHVQGGDMKTKKIRGCLRNNQVHIIHHKGEDKIRIGMHDYYGYTMVALLPRQCRTLITALTEAVQEMEES